MDSLKYCLVWAAALCYVAANPLPETLIGDFNKTSSRGPFVEGTVSVMVGGNLKIRDYKMPIKGELTWQVP